MHQSSATSAFADAAFPGDGNSPAFGQQHYTVDQVAEMWSISRDTIRRLFAAEPGVLKFVRPGNRYSGRTQRCEFPRAS
jgi:excisionase family DNA binding protein